MPKTAKLYEQEFNPRDYFKERGFWRVPREIAALSNKLLSEGAKLLYSVLMTRAGEYGTAYPSKKKLQKDLGNPSLKTLYRWQCELVSAGLIHVHQKGRGLTNNYYFLRSPLIGNATYDVTDTVRTPFPEVLETMRRERRYLTYTEGLCVDAERHDTETETTEQSIPANPYPYPFDHLATYDPEQQLAYGAAPETVKWHMDLKEWFDGDQKGSRPIPPWEVAPNKTPQEVRVPILIKDGMEFYESNEPGYVEWKIPEDLSRRLAEWEEKAAASWTPEKQAEWEADPQAQQQQRDFEAWEASGRIGPMPVLLYGSEHEEH